MKNKTELIAARVNQEEWQNLDRVAGILDIPASQIIREAVREKLEALEKRHPKLKAAQVETA